MSDKSAQPKEADRRASWISLGFEHLVHDVANHGDGSQRKPFDVLVVGSGYGGAVAAAQLAGCKGPDGKPIAVCVLERGQEYLEGAFPHSVDDLAGHVRFASGPFPQARGNLDALFDVRLGEDLNVLVANGLGGGSLINAGVMLEPDAAVLERTFPGIASEEWKPLFTEARALLGANAYAEAKLPSKGKALAGFSPAGRFKTVPITVALQARTSSAQVRLKECLECGDCATGCNHGAKDSLDVNLLVTAALRGAAIHTGATVLRLARGEGGWEVEAVPTNATLRERHGPPTRIHARRVILAAGTLGSTEILLKSRGGNLRFSAQLGRNFSGNGDMIAVIRGHKAEANAVACESDAPKDRRVGPTITASIDLRGDEARPYMIQEMAIPGALRRMFEEVTSTASMFHSLARFDWSTHGVDDQDDRDPCAVDPGKVRHSSVIAMMGDDGADGVIELRDDAAAGDGQVAIRWEQLRSGAPDGRPGSIYDRQMQALEDLAGKDGELLANPMWRLLPKDIEFLFDSRRGPALTVHPLGGCAMGADAVGAVVDSFGRVFDPAPGIPRAVHDGLVVLDGSIIPQALSVNPSLTITAVALRAARGLRDDWKLQPPAEDTPQPRDRPVLKADARPAVKPEPQYEIRERLGGPAWVPVPGSWWPWRRRFVEVTLAYAPFTLSHLMGRLHRHLDVTEGKVRIFRSEAAYRTLVREEPGSERLESKLDAAALHRGPLKGELHVLHRGWSWWGGRVVRAGWAWFLNRGGRDILQAIRGKTVTSASVPPPPGSLARYWRLLRAFLTVASRAGEIRLFEYDLRADIDGKPFHVVGRKRLTYTLDCNLWEQLERMRLKRFGSRLAFGRLDVDMNYFAAQRIPLMRVATQPNMPASLIDLGAFGAYIARLMVGIHSWSFRRPDTRPARKPQRLPLKIRRTWLERFVIACKIAWTDSLEAGLNVMRTALPAPTVIDIPMGHRDGMAVRIRLTRFPRESSDARPPVLMIHGYSASGTTFAHAAVRPALGEYLSYQGRDVWILDMRTSSGMETAVLPWTFEHAALQDIPVAVAHVLERTGRKQVDVVAHCMGAAMFSMAVLAQPEKGDPYYLERRQLPRAIRCAVLSQVGPLMQFSPLNVFRAYLMRYVRYYLGLSRFEFRVPEEPRLGEQLMDRFLSTLRYPRRERRFENRFFALDNSYVGTRHRIDSLYGRSFSLLNMNRAVLHEIDDFFGPLNLATVSQTLHFALAHRVTDSVGRACYLSRESRDKRWTFDTLSVHGVDNGLMDVATRNWIGNYFNDDPGTGPPPEHPLVQQREFAGAGHQDSLIGKTRVTGPIFASMRLFLEAGHAMNTSPRLGPWVPRAPWGGPVRAPAAGVHAFAVSGDPGIAIPDFALAVPVRFDPLTRRYQPVPIRGTVNQMQMATVFLLAVDTDGDGWHRIELANYFLDARKVDGVLILHCYDHTAVANVQAGAAWTPLGNTHRRQIAEVIGTQAIETNLSANDPGSPKGVDAILAELNDGKTLEERVNEFVAKTEGPAVDDAFIPALAEEEAATRIFAGSCQYPQGILDESVAWKSYERLARLLDAYREGHQLHAQRSLMLLVGDQVYTDSTAGLFDPAKGDDLYRQPYEDLFSNPAVKKVLRTIPSAMMLDDHEIRDNWEPSATGVPTPGETRARDLGVAAYKAFQRRANPVPPAPPPEPLWFTLRVGDVPVFVADSRTDRLPRLHGGCDAWSIMGDTQLDALLDWIRQRYPKDPGVPRIVACPAMLLPRKLAAMRTRLGAPASTACSPGVLASDSWQGFPASLAKLLACIADGGICNLIFVSGDEHLFCDARIRVRRSEAAEWTEIRSIHASPLYAPYPFANARPEEFAETDAFTFSANGAAYACEVEATFHPEVANGFVELVLARIPGNAWKVEASFHGAGDVLEQRPVVTQRDAQAAAFTLAMNCGS